MGRFVPRLLFAFFFLSGFCSLVYQVVWTRLAFASFGIIAPVLSVVLSVFMLGLSVGSWGGGRLIAKLVNRAGWSAIVFYGMAELFIGVGAFVVPSLFAASQGLLAGSGQLNSFSYLLCSALALAISIFPWCLCMGATFPFMIAYLRERDPRSVNTFSYLYVANVLGAMAGTILTAVVLVEALGFGRTLWVAACGNFLIAIASVALGSMSKVQSIRAADQDTQNAAAMTEPAPDRKTEIILFSTGFLAMAMEVVWSRGFVGVLKTQIYSFALILFTYLAATLVGSLLYRRDVRVNRVRSAGAIFFWMSLSALLPIYVDDPSVSVQYFWENSINVPSAIWLLASIVPLCALLGYLTPSLIDRYSGGDPRRVGSAYAANVVGCILGPLLACYVLLPHVSTRYALILLGLPFILFWLTSRPAKLARRVIGAIPLTAMLAYCLVSCRDFEERVAGGVSRSVIRRDYIASVAAISGADRHRQTALVVNGFGMTNLTPVTKFIAHLPIALHKGRPGSVLVICFGMGTTYRSALSWGIETTAVELVPSVPELFGFYHADAARYLSDPNGRIIIDDGRRYLSRCGRKFDIITVDPPPPVEAAGSSLLYSRDFYTLAKEHLNPNGIVQMWHVGADSRTDQAIIRSMYTSFPYVRCFGSVEGWGMHLLGSMQPIEIPPIDQLIARFPPAAKADLVEWNPRIRPAEFLNHVLKNEFDPKSVLDAKFDDQVTDDRPFNEYYLLRQLLRKYK